MALALGGRAGGAVIGLGVGALVAAIHGPFAVGYRAVIDPARPVEAVVQVGEHARHGAFGWSAAARTEILRQGARVEPNPIDVVLELPEDRQPEAGERLRVRGYLTRSAGYANRLPIDPGPPRLRVKAASLVRTEAQAGLAFRLSRLLRRRVESALVRAGDRAGSAFVRAWILGDPSALDPPTRRAIRRAGLAHLLAVSGFHVGLVAAFSWLVSTWLPGRARHVPPLVAIAAYVMLVGPLASILRAALMASLALAALWLRRPPNAANALGVAAATLVLARPAIVQEVAFQLTVAATAGLIALAPLLERAWRRLPTWGRHALAASAAAQLSTLPIVLVAFHQAAPLGLLANAWAIPWSAISLSCAIAWCLVAVAWPALGGASAGLLDVMALPFLALSETPASLWQVRFTTVGWLGAGLLTAALAALCLRPRWSPAALAAILLAAQGRHGGAPRLAVLDVGQGDAILLRDAEHAILVDGGGWSQGDFGGRVLLPALAAEGVHRLDVMVMTHSDRDHCGGLLDAVDYIVVREIWVAPGQVGRCARDLMSRPGPNLRVMWKGERRQVGEWALAALAPDPGATGSDNGRSLVLLAEARGARALLTGDVEARTEQQLVADGAPIAADVLKVAHHGSQTSTGLAFLRAVNPRLALISVGADNPFGHPHLSVLRRLEAERVPTLRTDLAGEVEVRFLGRRRIVVATPAAPR